MRHGGAFVPISLSLVLVHRYIYAKGGNLLQLNLFCDSM